MGLLGNSDGKLVTATKIKAKAQNRAINEERRQNRADERFRRDELESEERNLRREEEKQNLDEVKNIELDPSNKEELIKSITKLSSFVELYERTPWGVDPDEYLKVAKHKFDMALSLLQAIDPTNPILDFYLKKEQKKIEKKKKSKKTTKIILLSLASLILLGILTASINGWLALIIVAAINVVIYKWAFIKDKINNAMKK